MLGGGFSRGQGMRGRGGRGGGGGGAGGGGSRPGEREEESPVTLDCGDENIEGSVEKVSVEL